MWYWCNVWLDSWRRNGSRFWRVVLDWLRVVLYWVIVYWWFWRYVVCWSRCERKWCCVCLGCVCELVLCWLWCSYWWFFWLGGLWRCSWFWVLGCSNSFRVGFLFFVCYGCGWFFLDNWVELDCVGWLLCVVGWFLVNWLVWRLFWYVVCG